MSRFDELELELIALEQMLEQMKIDWETCSSLADGLELEKRMCEIDKQFEATKFRIEKYYNKQMAKAKARGLLLH
jgi:hypothetical protein